MTENTSTVTLTYTQLTVAFPSLAKKDGSSIYDEVNISLAASGGGSEGEFMFQFYDWGHQKGVLLRVFGDGLPCLYDPRVQAVIQLWREMPDPDKLTPEGLISLLVDNGAVPSRYHVNPQLDPTQAEIARLRARIAELEGNHG